MAKIYGYPKGGAFYDAFGGKIGEIEEVWAGDSFDRSMTCCNYVSAEDSNALSFATKDNVVAPSVAIDSFNNAVYSVEEKLRELQEQIDALKGTFEAPKGIRAALKTLQYTREVE